VASALHELGLTVGKDDLDRCRNLSTQLTRAHRFNTMAAVIIAAGLGSIDRLAERLGMLRAALYLAIGKAPSTTKPITLNSAVDVWQTRRIRANART
jgi:hypothetical protein